MRTNFFFWGFYLALVSSVLFVVVLVTFANEGLSILVALLSGTCLLAAFASFGFFLDGVACAIINEARS